MNSPRYVQGFHLAPGRAILVGGFSAFRIDSHNAGAVAASCGARRRQAKVTSKTCIL
jgi:hypothetical protein